MYNQQKPRVKGKGFLLLFVIVLFFAVGVYFYLNTAGKWLYRSNNSAKISTIQDTKETDLEGKVKGVASEEPGAVLAVQDEITENSLVFRLPVYFFDLIHAASGKFDELLEVGINLTVGNDATIGNDLDVAGDLTLSGAVISTGEITAPNVIYSVIAGDGITVSGTQDITITNDDGGSAQQIIKNFEFDGDTISAGSNDDTLTFESSGGVTLSTSGSTVTISSEEPDYTLAGWTDGGTTLYNTTLADNVGIGTSTAGYKLHVVGTGYVSGATTLDSTLDVTGLTTLSGGASISSGINNNSGGITNAGSITGATGFTSSGTITLSNLSTGILRSNVNGVISSSAINLAGGANEVTGALPVTNGGTGLTSATTGQILYASAANTFAALGVGSEGEVLTVSSGIPAWGTSGAGAPCATCIVNNPGSTQTITPAAATATGLVVKQASSGSVDVFRVESNDGASVFFKIDSSGNVTLGSQTSSGVFTVSPTSTDPISISPIAQGAGQYTGTITSSDLTQARTWTFPDDSGVVCLATGNCSGTAAGVGGSGTTNYLSKWSSTYGLTNSLLFDNGTNVGIGSTSPGAKLDVVGTLNVSALASLADDLQVDKHATISGSLRVDQAVDLNDTLGVAGATTLGSTLDVTGLATFGGNVGIGTTVPTKTLDIDGSVEAWYFEANNSGFRFDGDNDTGLIRLNSDQIAIEAGGTNFLSITNDTQNTITIGDSTDTDTDIDLDGNVFIEGSSGNVGIGTSIPVGIFNVEGAITGKALTIFNETGDQNIFTASASGITRFVIQNDGNVGIGTNVANGRLTVDGGSIKLLDAGEGITFGNSQEFWISDGARSMAMQSRGGVNFYINANNSLAETVEDFNIFADVAEGGGTTPLFTVKQGGNVGIGVVTPTQNVEIRRDQNANTAILVNNETNSTGSYSSYLFETTTKGGGFGLYADAFTGGGTLTHLAGRMGMAGYNGAEPLGLDLISNHASGDIRFYTGGLATTNERMRIDSTGNVGIGTTSPGAELNLASGSFKIGTSDCNNSFCLDGSGFDTGWNYTITNHNGGHLLLMPDGNVGIGTTSPGQKLDVNGSINFTGSIISRDDTDTKIVSSADQWEIQAGGLRFLTFDEGNADKLTGNLNRANLDFIWNGDTNYNLFYIDAGAETVGIGTSTPVGKFDIQGSITGKALAIFNETGDQNIFVASASGTNRFVIQNDGNVGIGVTNPTAYLDVNGTSAAGNSLRLRSGDTGAAPVDANQIIFSYSGGASYSHAIKSRHNGSADSGNAIDFYTWDYGVDSSATTGTKHIMTLEGTGRVGIGSTSPAQALDVVGSIASTGNLHLGAAGYIDDDATLGENSDDWIHLNGYIELKSNTSSYGIVLREDDTTGYFGLTQEGGYSYLADSTVSTSYFLRGDGANAEVRGNLGVGNLVPDNVLDLNTTSNDSGIELDNKLAISGYSGNTYLRLNNAGDFTSGVYVNGNLLVGGTATVTDLECTTCIDQGDLKTATGAVTVTTSSSVSMNNYNFFPNVQRTSGSDSCRMAAIQTSDSGTQQGRFKMDSCTSSTTVIRWRYVTASRPPELFGWYDPEQEIFNSFIRTEFGEADQYPVEPDDTTGLIPVQITVFGDEFLTMDIDEISHNYKLSRYDQPANLSSSDELMQIVAEHDACVLENPDHPSYCVLPLTAEGINYGKLEYSSETAAKWDVIIAENNAGSNTTGADVAELYNGDEDAEQPGTVVSVKTDGSGLIERTSNEYNTKVLGVVSTSPGLVLGKASGGNIELALTGRVPVNVSTVNGEIKAGDKITSSNILGVAMKATRPGVVIGTVLEDFDESTAQPCTDNPDELCGQVITFINIMSYDPSYEMSLDSEAELKELSLSNFYLEVTSAFIKNLGVESLRIKGVPLSEYIASIVGLEISDTENIQEASDSAEYAREAEIALLKELALAEEASTEAEIISEILSENISFADSITKFIKEVVFTAKTKFLASVEFVKEVTFDGSVRFSKENAGTVVIASGVTKVKVSFNKSFDQIPNIYLTNKNSLEGNIKLSQVEQDYFILELSEASDNDIEVQWLAILAEQTDLERIEILESGEASTQTELIQNSEPISTPEPSVSPEVADILEEVASQSAVLGATDSGEVAN